MFWVGVHLPALALEAFVATLDDAARARPVALIDQHQLTQVNAAAAARGVQPGSRRATALALAPDLLLGQADAVREAQALQAVAHAALAFTPAVCLAGGAGAAPQGVLLEVQASLRYFGGIECLLQRLRTALQPLGHRVQLACAPTASGAALLARWRSGLATGAHTTDTAALKALLGGAPAWLLGPGRTHWAVLQGMGLRTLADLQRLPRSGLARRFGHELLAELDRACGDAPEAHAWVTLPPRFASRLELFARADTAEQMLVGARVLLARLVAWAQAQHGRIAHFTLHMHHERSRHADVPAVSTLPIALAEPACDAAHLQLLLAERLGRQPLAAPALELSLQCDALVQAEAPNGELFASRSSEREGLVRLVERLQARLGRSGVQRLQLVADHRPEHAQALRPADAPPLPAAAAPALPPALRLRPDSETTLQRPVWLLSPPQRLHERDARPLLEGRPLQMLAGPERIETGWWDGDLVARDYFIAQAHDSTLVWVYRARLPLDTSEGQGWYLQGRFA